MTRLEKLVTAALIVVAVDVGVRLGAQTGRHQEQQGLPLGMSAPAQAQTPIVGFSLLPRYIITTNQQGNQIFVWEDEGKGYIPKIYTSGR